jgi:hypothetical protein
MIASGSTTSPSISTMPTLVESTQDTNLPTVQFTNVQDLFNVISSTTGDFLTVTSKAYAFSLTVPIPNTNHLGGRLS